MTDRVIYYSGSQPRSSDVLQDAKNAMIGDGWIMTAAFGCSAGNPTVKGFAATATNPASMTVNIAPGVIFSPAVVDLNPYSTLGADTTHSITKGGQNNDTVPIVFTAPLTSGLTQIFLIQCQLQTVDTGNTTLNYFDSANPGQVYSGPNNTGISQPTQRQDIAALTVVAGVPATSPVAPTVTTGWMGLYLVTIPYGTVAINQSMITTYPGAKFLTLSLCDLQSGVGSGSGNLGTVTQVNTGTGLTGGPITSTGTISLANTTVSAGSYTNANVTVNAQGQITTIANGTSSGGSGTVTSITAGGGLTGGTITTSGTIAIQASGAVGTYTNANITIDGFGRVITASNGSGGTAVNYQPQIDTINATLTTIEGEISTIEGEISTIEGEITTLQNNQTTTNGAITTIQGNIATLNTEFNTENTAITTINAALQKVRYRLTATLNINIATTGNDTTAAAAISGANPTPSSTPFATLQRAWNTIINAYDISGQTVNFNVANGTYNAGIIASGMTGLSDTGSVNVIGNVATPDSCFINVSQSVCFSFDQGIRVLIKGFKLSATQLSGDFTTGVGIRATLCQVTFTNIDFSNVDVNHIMVFGNGGSCGVLNGGTYTVSGSAGTAHVDVEPGGSFGSVLATCLISGSPSFGSAFYRSKNGVIDTYQTQYSGTQGNAIGPRYLVFANGILDNGGVDPDNGPATGNGQVLPGSSNGSTSQGGIII